MALQDYNSLLVQNLDQLIGHLRGEDGDAARECLEVLEEHGLKDEAAGEIREVLADDEPDWSKAVLLAEAQYNEIAAQENPFADSEAEELEDMLEDAFFDLEDTGFRDIAGAEVDLDEDVLAGLALESSSSIELLDPSSGEESDADGLEEESSDAIELGVDAGVEVDEASEGAEESEEDPPKRRPSVLTGKFQIKRPDTLLARKGVEADEESEPADDASEAEGVDEASDAAAVAEQAASSALVAALDAAAAEADEAASNAKDPNRQTRPNLTPNLGNSREPGRERQRPFDSGQSQARYAAEKEPPPPTHRLRATADLSGEIATGAPDLEDDFDFGFGNDGNATPFRPADQASSGDEFDFDLGFGDDDAGSDFVAAEPEEDFEFDLGFTNPEQEPSDPATVDVASGDFDLFGEDDAPPTRDNATPMVDDNNRTSMGPATEEAAKRERELTPHRPLSAVDQEDMFFELAEALAADSSVGEMSNPFDSTKGNSAETNPFAHQAPTGTHSPMEAAQSVVAGGQVATNLNAILLEARRLRSTGELGAALDITKKILSRGEHEDAEALRVEIEAELEARHLETLGSLEQTPKLAIEMSEMSSLDLDHRAGFLMSQIDGMCSYLDLIELSGMSRLEALGVFVDLVEQGVVEV